MLSGVCRLSALEGRMKVIKAFSILMLTSLAVVAFYSAYTRDAVWASRKQNLEQQPFRSLAVLSSGRLAADIGSSFDLEQITRNVSQEISTRSQKVSEGCKFLRDAGTVFKDLKPSQLGHLVVNDEHKTLYCYIPKVACTNLKRVFLVLSGHMNTSDPLKLESRDVHYAYDKYLTYLDSYSPKEISYRIQNYRKVIFIREPLERMLSAYRNKFENDSPYFRSRFGRRIIKRFRGNASPESLQKGHDVTFLEFVQYLLDPVTMQHDGYNEHWDKSSNLCFPCQVQYDFVGKYETLDEDVNYLLQSMGVSDKIKFPKRSALYKSSKTEDMLLKYYSQVPSYLLKHLWKVYQRDYLLFDYPFPDVISKLHDSKKRNLHLQ